MRPNASTTVRIDCLNNGDSWYIDPANLSSKQDFQVSGNQISFGDSTIVFKNGGVYTIVFDGLKDENNEVTSYSYRTVYMSASAGNDNG